MSGINWECPHCDRAVTITEGRRSSDIHRLGIENAEGDRIFRSLFIVCPNPACRRLTLTASLNEAIWVNGQLRSEKEIKNWNLVPDSRAKNFPPYIPQVIIDDYREACLIRDLSPKASATLSRRCLQGMIRDFWNVKPSRLVDEIAAIKPQIDPLIWDAIDAVRKIGNIGAHMEKDINLIVDVDPNEANLLIELIETLLREWYVNREERRNRMNHLIAAAAAKKPTSP